MEEFIFRATFGLLYATAVYFVAKENIPLGLATAVFLLVIQHGIK